MATGWEVNTAYEEGVPGIIMNTSTTYSMYIGEQFLQMIQMVFFYDANIPNEISKSRTIHSCHFPRKANHLWSFRNSPWF